MKRFILSALFFIALLVIWHLLVLAKVWSVVLLPDPISVWEYLKGAAEDGTLLQASLVTMRRLWLATSSALRLGCRSGC
jgi:NitT/TauT family transport system permease protein